MILIPKILILEDEETFVLRFKIILQKVGISTQEFRPFKSGESLISQIEQDFPDIIFLDLNLKSTEGNGFSVLEKIKQKYNGKLKAGVISSSDNVTNIKKASQLGARFYIVKSGDISIFTERIKQFKSDFLDNDTSKFLIYN